MNLYIEIENGVPKNHPAFEDNLLQAFGSIPEPWEPFVRVERPTLGVYQVLDNEEPLYEKVDGVWTDVWSIRDMTEEEKIVKQQDIMTTFSNREYAANWSTWVFDVATGTMQPPIPRPERVEGKLMLWCGADNNWKEVPTRPIDDNKYKFDFLAWQWVVIT